jgi:hypothetical protein
VFMPRCVQRRGSRRPGTLCREWGRSVAAPPDSSPALGSSSPATQPTSGSTGYSTSRATPAGPGENGSASSGLSRRHGEHDHGP